jgi:hypothetical protein
VKPTAGVALVCLARFTCNSVCGVWRHCIRRHTLPLALGPYVVRPLSSAHHSLTHATWASSYLLQQHLQVMLSVQTFCVVYYYRGDALIEAPHERQSSEFHLCPMHIIAGFILHHHHHQSLCPCHMPVQLWCILRGGAGSENGHCMAAHGWLAICLYACTYVCMYVRTYACARPVYACVRIAASCTMQLCICTLECGTGAQPAPLSKLLFSIFTKHCCYKRHVLSGASPNQHQLHP